MNDAAEIKQLNVNLSIVLKQLTRTLDLLEKLLVEFKKGDTIGSEVNIEYQRNGEYFKVKIKRGRICLEDIPK